MSRNKLSMSSDDDGGDSSEAWDTNTDWLDLNFIDWVRLPILLFFQTLGITGQLTKNSRAGIVSSAISGNLH